jgi:hypothetical protein
MTTDGRNRHIHNDIVDTHNGRAVYVQIEQGEDGREYANIDGRNRRVIRREMGYQLDGTLDLPNTVPSDDKITEQETAWREGKFGV